MIPTCPAATCSVVNEAKYHTRDTMTHVASTCTAAGSEDRSHDCLPAGLRHHRQLDAPRLNVHDVRAGTSLHESGALPSVLHDGSRHPRPIEKRLCVEHRRRARRLVERHPGVMREALHTNVPQTCAQQNRWRSTAHATCAYVQPTDRDRCGHRRSRHHRNPAYAMVGEERRVPQRQCLVPADESPRASSGRQAPENADAASHRRSWY